MTRRPTPWRLLGVLLAFTLVGAACGDGDNTPEGNAADEETATTGQLEASPTSEPATGPSDDELAAATLNASGATFPEEFYAQAIDGFKEDQPNVTVNYQGVGSGAGRQALADQLVDFAGSDATVDEEDVAGFKGGEFLYFPTVAAPITVAYNLSGVDELNLSPEAIAGIFSRTITTWNDPAIAADNAGATLPATPIVVAHRAESSGTTDNFTSYLEAAAPDAFTLEPGSTVEWPADTQAGQGNSGVAQIVSSTAGAIGYVDLSDANATNLSVASVRNAAGEFVEPTTEAATAALEEVEVEADLSYDPLNAPGAEAYPITAPTWIIAYKNQPDAAKGNALKAFLGYVLGDAQEEAAEIDYAPLPDNLRERALAQIDQLVVSQ